MDPKKSDNVKELIAAILKVVRSEPFNDRPIIETWIAYRILQLQIESSILDEIDEYVKEAFQTSGGKKNAN